MAKHQNSDGKPLAFKLWGYFSAFSVFLMILLWFLQTIFLQTFYESNRAHQLTDIGRDVLKTYSTDNYEELVNVVMVEHNVFAYILDGDGKVLAGNTRFHFPFHRIGVNNHVTRKIHIANNLKRLGKTILIPQGNSNRNVATYLNSIPGKENVYLYLYSPLARVDTTTMVLQEQLIIVMIISLLISFFLAYILSRRLSKPISDITKSAKLLEDGNYRATFFKGDYKEVSELASVLNNTAMALSKSDELRRDLLANVSHDLRTPLTIIKSYAEMIRDISGNDEVKRESHTNIIIDETNRLSALVNDILDLSKLEAGESAFEHGELCLSEAVATTLESFKVFEKEGYTFNVNIEDGVYVNGDYRRLSSVIYNLILNAVNYTGDDKAVEVVLKKSGGNAVFEVTDTGVGIDKDDIPKVWQRYYRSSKTHKRDVVGSGLGLSIVKMILSAHNADFGVDSKVGEGSTFWFKIKLNKRDYKKSTAQTD